MILELNQMAFLPQDLSPASTVTEFAGLKLTGDLNFDSGIIDLSTQTVDITLDNAVDALNFGSNTLSIDGLNGRVGIGTSTPLNYAGAFGLEISATDPVFRMNDSDGVVDKSNYEIRAIGAAGFEGFQFRTVNDANTVFKDLLFLAQGGNVGVGTVTPISPLTAVGANDGTPILSIGNDATGATTFDFSRNATTGALFIQGTQAGFNNIVLAPTGGNVGIGTSTPGAKLDIAASDIGIRVTNDTFDDWLIQHRRSDDTQQFGIKGVGGVGSMGLITNGLTRVTIEKSSGNVGIGTTALPTGGGTPVLALGVATGNPTGIGANTAGIFVKDVSASGELFAFDEAGNVTQLSSHDPITGEYIIESENIYSGRKMRVDFEALIHEVEKLSGKKFMTNTKLPPTEIQDWDENQAEQTIKRDKEIEKWDVDQLSQKNKRDQEILEWEENEDREKDERPIEHVSGDRPLSYTAKAKPKFLEV